MSRLEYLIDAMKPYLAPLTRSQQMDLMQELEEWASAQFASLYEEECKENIAND